MVSRLQKGLFTPQFNHLIYLHLLLSPGLMRVYESIHQPHSSTYLCNDHVNIYFSCVNADVGLFYYHPNQKGVQMGLFCVPVYTVTWSFSYLHLSRCKRASARAAGEWCSSQKVRGGKALVLFESLLDKSKQCQLAVLAAQTKREENRRGFSRSASNLYATDI